MYLTMRVTGTIWAAIVLHGLTDPTTILSTGGLDTSVTTEVSGAAAITSLLTVLLVVFGVIAVFLIRDRIGEERHTPVSA